MCSRLVLLRIHLYLAHALYALEGDLRQKNNEARVLARPFPRKLPSNKHSGFEVSVSDVHVNTLNYTLIVYPVVNIS